MTALGWAVNYVTTTFPKLGKNLVLYKRHWQMLGHTRKKFGSYYESNCHLLVSHQQEKYGNQLF